MDQTKFEKVTEFLGRVVQEKQVPGVVVGITNSEKAIYKKGFGYAHFEKKIPMTENTVFDLASLTKVIATLPSILQLLESGLLDLDDPVYTYFPQFEKYHSELTLKHLLTHTSGFQPEVKFYLQNISKEEAIQFISQIRDKKKPGYVVIYSDLNFILLGQIIEKITGMSLSTYTSKFIYEPLGMTNTYFNPPQDAVNKIASTEFLESINDYQWGKVHDENALHFGGVSGHAGLFSNLEDLSKYARMLINGGISEGQKILSEQSIQLSTISHTKNFNLNRGLGWQLYDTSSFSGQFLQDGFGHTGFTGTSIWFSKKNNYAVTLLTNRIHFGRDTSIHRLRKIVHNLIALEMN